MKTTFILAAFDVKDFVEKYDTKISYIFFIIIIALMVYNIIITQKMRRASKQIKSQETTDTSMPAKITITSDKECLNINETSLISFKLNYPLPNFTLDNIKVTGGEISNLTGSKCSYSAIFTPIANELSSATIDVQPPLLIDSPDPLTIGITKEPTPTANVESSPTENSNPFKNLKPPTGDKIPCVIFHEIRSEMNDIFNKARVKFDQGNLGLIGAREGYPRVLKLEQVNDLEKLYRKKSTEFKDTDNWFFIGDIHGDFLALYTILEEIKKEPNFKICFLGDLVDRGPYDAECFALLLKTIIDYPERIIWILGNHDEGIYKTNKDIFSDKVFFPENLQLPIKEVLKHVPAFNSSVLPAEFLFWLNNDDPNVKKSRIFCGTLFVDIAKLLPRAVLFPSGLLATHGGFPLSDMWDSLTNMEAFSNKRCLTDFTWNRAANKKKSLISIAERPKQASWEFGYEDLEKFCEKVKDIFPVNAVIRGHDHVKEGWENFDLYKKVPLLTLNSFGFNYYDNSLAEGKYKQNFVYYGLSKDKILPDARKLIPVDSQIHKDFYVQSFPS